MMSRYSYACLLTFACCLHSFQGNILQNSPMLIHSATADVQLADSILTNTSRTKRQEPNNACPPGQTNCVNGHQELAFLTRKSIITLFYLDGLKDNPIDLPLDGLKVDTAGVDYDPIEGYIYWTDENVKKIQKAKLNGSDRKDVVSTDIEKPCEIALDLIARNLYWTDVGKHTIEVIRLTDGYRKVVIDNLVTPRVIAVAPELGWLFWSNWDDDDSTIERSNLDGSERIVIISGEKIRTPNFITLDTKNFKIYWMNHKYATLSYAQMDGTNRKDLHQSTGFPYGLILMGDYLYWFDWFSYQIRRVHKQAGGDIQDVSYIGPLGTNLKAINLRSAIGSNLCKENNGRCSQLCFYRHNDTKVCSCQADYSLAVDKHTCVRPGSSLGCILPRKPNNGRWFFPLNEDINLKPGESVEVGSILQFGCFPGYKLNEDNPLMACLNAGWNKNPPMCSKLCPIPHSVGNTEISCFNRAGSKIKCSEVTDGSYANFECAPYYESTDLRTRRYCIRGTWNLWPPQCLPKCGEKRVSAVLFAVNGTDVNKGDYPWTTALYEKDEDTDDFFFICGGTMLTQNIILTAAHCVTNIYGDTLSANIYKIAVGKYYKDYGDSRDKQAQYSDIELVLVHPKYRSDSRRYASDIAVLITKDTLTFSGVVQPACYRNLNSINLVPNDMGIVAGWGYSTAEKNSPDTLQELTVPYKDDATCARELTPDWADKYLTYDKFCAGYHNQSRAVCEGDSGSGLVFKHRDRFFVLGIVSLSKNANYSCDIEVSGLYTKVSVHYEWLEAVIANYTFQSSKECGIGDELEQCEHLR